ncbi:hypothetical protein BX666DRAFT_2022255 [Dichotomocladium elegans]|nr:hypothetical protein BX666DRAFT_2022255 [Dichotomocladium elegans]
MALDFLSSDIIFPSDSSEPKLATGIVTKLPEPVDWAFHDYYSTASEKAAMPLHSLTDYCNLESLQKSSSNGSGSGSSSSSSGSSSSSSNNNNNVKKTSSQGDQIGPSPPTQDHQQYLRAILCGALETVNNSMQDNHLTRLDKMVDITTAAKEENWRWEDDIMSNSSGFSFPYQHRPLTLSSGAGSLAPQDNDHDGDPDYPSPVYVEDAEEDLMSSGLTSFIISALPPPPPTPPLEDEDVLGFSPPSQNDRVPYFYSTPSPVTPAAAAAATAATHVNQDRRGKPAIAKSTVWQNLVSRLKKNLTSPRASNSHNNKKEMMGPSATQPHLSSNPLKRLFKTRLH